MPPFLNTNCTYCKKPNRFDLAILRKNDASLVKGIANRGDEKDEEFEVTCQHCGRKFKLPLEGGRDG